MSASLMLVKYEQKDGKYYDDTSELIGSTHLDYSIFAILNIFEYAEEIELVEDHEENSYCGNIEIIPTKNIPAVIDICDDRLREYYKLTLDNPTAFAEYAVIIKYIMDARFMLIHAYKYYKYDDSIVVTLDY